MVSLAKWSLEDYHLMIASGVFKNRSVELLEGEIVEMSPEAPLHRYINDRVAEYLRGLLKNKAKVFEAHPITLNDNTSHNRASEPEPDIAIVSLSDNNYLTHHPYPEDIYWLIEIANTTLENDLTIKKKIYANAGIKEYWVINLSNSEIVIFTEPFKSNYKNKIIVDKGVVSPLAFPDLQINLEFILNFS